MDSSLPALLGFSLVPLVATLVGACAATVWVPPPAVRSAIQHFAAGAVFAAVALELLPAEREQAPEAVVVGFALGVAAMLVLRHLTGELEQGEGTASPRPTRLLGVIAVDQLVDGLVLGVGFAAETKTGILLTIALTLEVGFVGLAAAAALSAARLGRAWVIGAPTALALLLVLGAVLGGTAFAALPRPAFGVVLAFGSAAMLYLVTEELLVEAHEVPETQVTTAMFFVGFVALLVIDMLA